MTRDSLWLLFAAAVGLALMTIALLSFPFALAHGIWWDLREWWGRR